MPGPELVIQGWMWHGPCPRDSQPRCGLRQLGGQGGGAGVTGQGRAPNPVYWVAQADFQEEGQPGQTSRSGPSKGLRRALTENFKTMARALANATGNCLCSPLPREPAISVLPWRPRWKGGPRAFPERVCPTGPPRGQPTQNGIFRPLFGLYSPISLLRGSYPLFMGECSWDPPATSSQDTAAPTIRILWVPGRTVWSSGCAWPVNRNWLARNREEPWR